MSWFLPKVSEQAHGLSRKKKVFKALWLDQTRAAFPTCQCCVLKETVIFPLVCAAVQR
jgi:hypothetical protein